MSFTSSIHSSHGISGSGGSGGLLSDRAQKPSMGPKVEVVYNLLTMLFSHDRHNVSQKLLHMSANPETRSTLHQVGKLEKKRVGQPDHLPNCNCLLKSFQAVFRCWFS